MGPFIYVRQKNINYLLDFTQFYSINQVKSSGYIYLKRIMQKISLKHLGLEAEIKRAIKQISKSSNFKKIADHQFIPDAILGYIKGKEESSLAWIFPCYRDIGEEKINREILKNKLNPVFLNGKKIVPRRVVIATNIAETSLTVPDALYVVDSGMIKQPEWDRETRTTRLVPKRHSQDGCKQRWGRVGRVKRGVVYTLYTKEEFENFDTKDYLGPAQLSKIRI